MTDAERVLVLLREGYQVDQILGKATGAPEYEPEMGAPDGDVCTAMDLVSLAEEAAQRIRVLAFELRSACDWIETGAEPMVAVASMRKALRENPVG